MAERAGVNSKGRATLVQVALMGWVGCIADSRDAATWFGDDIAYRAGVFDLDMAPLPFLGYLLRQAGSDRPLPIRVARKVGVLLDGGRSVQQSLRAHCQVTSEVARRLGLPDETALALRYIFGRWDGKGLPEVAGEDVPRPVRIWQLADVADVHFRRGGADAVEDVVRARRATAFDPGLVDLLCADIDGVYADLDNHPAWDDLAALDPMLAMPLRDSAVDDALTTVADWVDLKSPWFTGYSRSVADLAEEAARRLALPPGQVRRTRRAALIHGLGRAGIPNTLWDATRPLTTAESERLRLSSYYTERILARSPLQGLGEIAASAHERLDGSGQHRGLTGAMLSTEARILAVAALWRTKVADRPHRDALTPGAAADLLRGQAATGRLDERAVDAVLGAAGQPRGA
ncbi:MAG: HD-GYP domain-containing protein, partial [Thermocrispum sp.]